MNFPQKRMREEVKKTLSHVHDMWHLRRMKLLPFLPVGSRRSSTAIKEVLTQNKGVIIFILVLQSFSSLELHFALSVYPTSKYRCRAPSTKSNLLKRLYFHNYDIESLIYCCDLDEFFWLATRRAFSEKNYLMKNLVFARQRC